MKLSSATAIVAVFTGVFGSVPLAAQTGSDWDYRFHKRFYLGVGGGVSNLEPDTDNVANLDVVESQGTAAQVFLGWDFSRRLSFELQYIDLGEAELSQNGIIEYAETSVSGLFYLWNSRTDDQYADLDGLDLRQGFSLFGRLGVGQMENEANVGFDRENDFQVLLGAGVEYGFGGGFAARLEYTSFDTDAQYAGLGLLYRFGGPASVNSDDDLVYLPELPGPATQAQLPAEPPAPPAPVPAPAPAPVQQAQVPAPATLPQATIPGPSDQALAGVGVAGDQDGDGVADLIDDCADSAVGVPVNQFGCAAFGGTLEGVTFLTGSDTLTSEAITALDRVAAILDSSRGRVSVEAHTDGQGEVQNNLELARRRAISVVRYLVNQGIALDRFEARAFGESRPIASNDSAEGRRANRRVELNPIP